MTGAVQTAQQALTRRPAGLGKPPAAVPPAGPKVKLPAGTKYMYLMWFIILCDPQWWIAAYGIPDIRRVPTLLFALMLPMVFIRPPKNWFPPLFAFIIYTIAIMPLAYNRGQAFGVVKMLIAYYVLAIATLAYVRNVKQAVPIVSAALLWHYIWWVALGSYNGLVRWHPNLRNYDGFGPIMVIGIGSCYFYGLATSNKKERWLAFATSLGCCVGLVSSYARGAVISGVAVLVWMWLRSNRKGVTTVAVVASVIVVAIAGAVFSGSKRGDADSNFFAEMSTIGSGDGTQTDREVIWELAWRVFAKHPLVGVGAENFGPYAAGNFAIGETGGQYDQNPGRLYTKKLHSTFFQVLCEYGIFGSAIFAWMVVDFFKRNIALRRKGFVRRWKQVSGGRLDLKQLSFAIEVSMVGYMASGLFYNQLFGVHWFYTLVTINTLLYYLSKPPRPARRSLMVAPAT